LEGVVHTPELAPGFFIPRGAGIRARKIKIFNRKKERLFLFFERNREKNPVLDLPGIARLLIHLQLLKHIQYSFINIAHRNKKTIDP
jgi:hypothetical protein